MVSLVAYLILLINTSVLNPQAFERLVMTSMTLGPDRHDREWRNDRHMCRKVWIGWAMCSDGYVAAGQELSKFNYYVEPNELISVVSLSLQ